MKTVEVPVATFSEILQRVERKIELDDAKIYKRIGVRLYGNGTFVRETCSGAKIATKKQYVIKDCDIVYNRLFAWKGSFAVAEGVDNGIVSGEFPTYSHDNQKIILDYLRFFFRTSFISGQAKSLSRGASSISRFRLHQRDFARMTIPLPSKDEQERIVAHLRFMFTRTQLVRQAFSQIPKQTNQLRLAILSKAFRGELTGGSRDDNMASDLAIRASDVKQQVRSSETTRNNMDVPSIGHTVEPISRVVPYSLPVGWVWSDMSELSECVVDCLHSTPKFQKSGKYCIDTNCIVDGRIMFERARRVSESTYAERIRRLKPRAGDIIFAREATVGTAVVVPDDVELCLGQRVMMFRPWREVDSRYVMWALNSPTVRNQINALLAGTTVPHLNVADAKRLAIPLAPYEEQLLIASKIEKMLKAIEPVHGIARESASQLDLLEQSVLARAFSVERIESGISSST